MASLVLFLTCTDGTSGPAHPRFASLAVTPVFPASLAVAGLPLDNVRLIVVRPPSDTLLDKGYAFPAGETQITVSEAVPLHATSEVLSLTLEYLSGDVLLFSGSLLAEIHAGPVPDAPVEVPLTFVGPGAQVARLSLGPRDTVVTFGAVFPMRVTAVDAEGGNVAQFYVSWGSSDPDHVPDAAGMLRVGNTRSTLRLIARSPPTGVSDSTTVQVTAPPAQLTKTAGDNQTGVVGSRLPNALEVQVRGTDELPVSGVMVTFAAVAGGAVDAREVITDAGGRARTGATLGPTPGGHSYSASAVGVGPVTFAATAVAEPVPPTVALTSSGQVVSEGAGTATITAQLSSVASQVVSVPFTVGGTAGSPGDYTITASPVTIPAGSTTGTIAVTVVNDGVAEPDETVVVTIGAPTNAVLGAPATHTLTIAGQTPAVSFTAAAQTVGEGVGTATITAQLSSVASQAVTVPFTVGGTAGSPGDYTITASPVTIPAGSTTGTITVTVVNDAVAEPSETVVVTMGTPTNATATAPTVHTLTIAGQTPSVSFTAAAQTVGEEVGTATITAQLSSVASQAVTVPFTVGGTAGSLGDYTITASPVTIPAGSTTGTITVTVVNDTVVEPSETVIVTLGAPTNAVLGAISAHTVTITDNDVRLTALFAGRGFGTVTTQGATPAISCTTGDPPAQCSATYTTGTQVTLLAAPVPTGEGIFRFEGWTGTGTGFTCTTSPTCVVTMNQTRQVTARFSTIGTLSLSPSSVGFSQPERGTATPASVAVTATNVGERPLTLSSTIPITYPPGVAPWLSAQIDKLVIDTLSPAILTLSVLSNQLPAGTYGATVILRDEGLQFSWTVSVTLTVTPPTPPLLSNISYVQVGSINTCDIFGGPLGTGFSATYSYSDAGGDVRPGATILVNYVFSNGGPGSFDGTPFSSIGGNGFSGTIRSDACFLFGGASFVDVSFRVTDLAGSQSQPITVRITRPSGAN